MINSCRLESDLACLSWQRSNLLLLTSWRGIYPYNRQVQNTFWLQETLHTHVHLSDQTVNLSSLSPLQQHVVSLRWSGSIKQIYSIYLHHKWTTLIPNLGHASTATVAYRISHISCVLKHWLMPTSYSTSLKLMLSFLHYVPSI